jgi:hypothetical protein
MFAVNAPTGNLHLETESAALTLLWYRFSLRSPVTWGLDGKNSEQVEIF